MKIILILSTFIAAALNPAFALEIKDRNEYLTDVRGDDGSIYLNRVSIHKQFNTYKIDAVFFSEAQWNTETNEWEKLLVGAELGKSFWKYLRASQSVHIVSGEILDYVNFHTDSSSVDTTTRVALQIPLITNLSFYAAGEFSINLEKGKDEYCESIAEVLFSPRDLYSIGIGWRHTDRIHNFDSDYMSTSFTLRF